MEFYCKDSEATERLGWLLGVSARSGDVFCFSGDLGAGKTLMCRGLAQAQGVDPAAVNSPTFALMNVYQGSKEELRHFDLYRLNSVEELEDMGFYEYAGGPGITMIEWAELYSSELPEERLQVTLKLVPEGRQVFLEPVGQRYEKLCEDVQRSC